MNQIKTRLKLTVFVLTLLAFVAFVAIFKNMEVLATACVTGLMTTLSTYIWGQTKRPSKADE
jgi:tryptophan-rich sensory protein